MNSRTLLVLCTLTAAVVGFLAGYLGREKNIRAPIGGQGTVHRAESRPTQLSVAEVLELEKKAQRAQALEMENEALRGEIKRISQAQATAEEEEEDLPLGSRRPDGSIVGGARWPDTFVRTATAYIDRLFTQFIEEANLTPEQERRLRSELSVRIGQMMQLSADITNGDITADELYENIAVLSAEGRADIAALLDEEQHKTYKKFFKKTQRMIRDQVVYNEMASLKAELKLDSEQEKHVKRIVEQRYNRVEERHGDPVPNLMFKAIRREGDSDVYEETAAEIRGYLRPDQVERFDREEKAAATSIYTYRTFLIPKTVVPAKR